MVEHRKQAGGVYSNHPIRFAPAKRGSIEPVVILTGAKVVKALADSVILHRGNPKPFHGFGTAGKIVYGSEDKLALAPRITGIDDLAYIGALHERREQIELLFLISAHGILPGLRHDGEVASTPLGIFLVVHLG